jgi:hypothetical protein
MKLMPWYNVQCEIRPQTVLAIWRITLWSAGLRQGVIKWLPMFRNNLLLRFSRKMHFPPYTDQQNLVGHNVGSQANVNLSSNFTGLDVCVVCWQETAEWC